MAKSQSVPDARSDECLQRERLLHVIASRPPRLTTMSADIYERRRDSAIESCARRAQPFIPASRHPSGEHLAGGFPPTQSLGRLPPEERGSRGSSDAASAPAERPVFDQEDGSSGKAGLEPWCMGACGFADFGNGR